MRRPGFAPGRRVAVLSKEGRNRTCGKFPPAVAGRHQDG
jgi:hypothetical protein